MKNYLPKRRELLVQRHITFYKTDIFSYTGVVKLNVFVRMFESCQH